VCDPVGKAGFVVVVAPSYHDLLAYDRVRPARCVRRR